MSFLSYPVKTNVIDSKKTVLKSQHVFFIYLYAHNLQVISPNALYLQYRVCLLKYEVGIV